jgi:hypothetical protein
MGPLSRRAPWRLFRSGPWGLLVAGAFLILAAAAASVPCFEEAAANAAMDARLAAVPANAAAGSAPVVRVVGGELLAARKDRAEGLADIPGLGPGSATAGSFGVESNGREARFVPFVSNDLRFGRGTGPPSGQPGEKAGRARIFGDDELAHSLLPAPGSRFTSGPASDLPAVWLPQPLARTLMVDPGDEVQVGASFYGRSRATAARVAGIYQVDSSGVVPADPPGSQRWAYRRDDLPHDSEFVTLPSALLVTDVADAVRLAKVIGDDLIYALEGQLRPARPTLAQAEATVAGIERRQVYVRDPVRSGNPGGDVSEQVVSGLPTLVTEARSVADRTVAWTLTAGTAGLVLGLLAVLAVAVFGLAQRAIEIRHAVGSGVRASAIGLMAAAEVIPVALVAAIGGTGIGWALVAEAGPPGSLTATGLRAAAGRSALAVTTGVALVAGASVVAAVRAGRLSTPSRLPRPVPGEALLVVVALTALAGLLSRPADARPPSALDLLVPVLLLAAVGAIGARLLLRSAGLAASRWLSGSAWSRRPAIALAVRRVAAGGRSAVLLITMLTVGFGFLAYTLTAAAPVHQVTEDRTAVLAGARATVAVDASWLLDDGAAQASEQTVGDDPLAPVPLGHNPPLPAGVDIVWRTRVTVAPEYDEIDLLVVDPARLARVANWGSGPELARARQLLGPMAAADRTAAARAAADRAAAARAAGGRPADAQAPPITAIGVGSVPLRPGDPGTVATISSGDVPIRTLDVVPAFPGYAGTLPMIVVPADSFFAALGAADPRVRPPKGTSGFDTNSDFRPSLWSATDQGSLEAVLQAHDLDGQNPTSWTQVRLQQPDVVAADRSIGYQVALGWCVAGLAVLGFAMFADRAATRARAADLLLGRMGMGRKGIRRSWALELAGFAVIALVLAGVGLLAIVPLGPRLLEPGGGVAPPFVLRVAPFGLVATVVAIGGGWLLALVVGRSRTRARSDAEVIRDAD